MVFFLKLFFSVLEVKHEKYVVVDSESIVLLNGVEIDFENEIARTGYIVNFFFIEGLGEGKSEFGEGLLVWCQFYTERFGFLNQ